MVSFAGSRPGTEVALPRSDSIGTYSGAAATITYGGAQGNRNPIILPRTYSVAQTVTATPKNGIYRALNNLMGFSDGKNAPDEKFLRGIFAAEFRVSGRLVQRPQKRRLAISGHGSSTTGFVTRLRRAGCTLEPRESDFGFCSARSIPGGSLFRWAVRSNAAPRVREFLFN